MKYNKETLLRRFDAHMQDIRESAKKIFEAVTNVDDTRYDEKREYIKQYKINENPEKLIELRNELKKEARPLLIALAFLPDVEITVKDE